MSILIHVHATAEAFTELREDWQDLAHRTQRCSVFSTWEWLECWWRHYGKGRNLLLLTATHEGKMVGVLPLYTESARLLPGLNLRVLRVVGTGGDTSPDYLGPLLAQETEGQVAAQLADALLARAGDWDRFELTDLAEGPFAEALLAAARARQLSMQLRPDKKIHIARLPASWDAYLAAMPRDRRYRVRHQRRTMMEKLGAEFELSTGAADTADALASLEQLHRARWNSKDPDKGAFRSTEYLGFHAEVIARCQKLNWIRFYRIKLPERTIAVFYCYRYRNETLYFQSGFDPSLEKYSLGNNLMGFAIESSIAEGATIFDMLQGDHAYKQSWCNDTRSTFCVTGNSPTLRGYLHSVKETLRRRLRPAGHDPAAARS